MPRIPRGQVAGNAYHVLNRGNGGAVVFHKDGDYTAFLDLLATAKTKHPVHVFGFCLMPNHFHLVVQPATVAALSGFMQWCMTSHVRRYHRHYRSHGHVWQGRFKSFPIQQDSHLLTVLRYVLRNPVRAGLVEQAVQWPWSSLRVPHLADAAPIPLPEEGTQWIDQPLVAHELTTLRTCVNRQQPFGTPEWQQQLATALGLSPPFARVAAPPNLSSLPLFLSCVHSSKLASPCARCVSPAQGLPFELLPLRLSDMGRHRKKSLRIILTSRWPRFIMPYRATETEQTISTDDTRDFIHLANKWHATGLPHSGILLCHFMPLRQLARRFQIFLLQPPPTSFADQIIWLPPA